MTVRWRTWIVGLATWITLSGSAHAAKITFLVGSLDAPDGLYEGASVAEGTVLESASDALVMVEHTWPSDIGSRLCIEVIVFGYGRSYTVSEAGSTPGSCATTVPDPSDFEGPQPFLARETRYGDSKYDEPNLPRRVTKSIDAWRRVERWKSEFRKEKALKTPVLGSSVFSKPDSIPARVPVSKPPEPTQPEPPQPDAPVQKWSCDIDLQSSGAGTMSIILREYRFEGTIAAKGTTRPIRGRWTGSNIKFWRELSTTSGQRFVGVVTKPEPGLARMGGRFANAFSGVWSADCRLASSVDKGERYTVMLVSYPDKAKINVIKTVRSLTGWGLKETKAAVESVPTILNTDASAQDAERMLRLLSEVGAVGKAQHHD